MGLEIRALNEVLECGLGSNNGRSSADKAHPDGQENDSNQQQFANQYRLAILSTYKEDFTDEIAHEAALCSRSDNREDHTLMPYEVPLRRRSRFIAYTEGNEERTDGHRDLLVCKLGSHHLVTG